jgi:hypothetical protein
MTEIEEWITITPRDVGVGVLKPERGVAMQLRIDRNHLDLAPNVGVAVRMTPAEARRIGKLLLRKADEAEVGLSRH